MIIIRLLLSLLFGWTRCECGVVFMPTMKRLRCHFELGGELFAPGWECPECVSSLFAECHNAHDSQWWEELCETMEPVFPRLTPLEMAIDDYQRRSQEDQRYDLYIDPGVGLLPTGERVEDMD